MNPDVASMLQAPLRKVNLALTLETRLLPNTSPLLRLWEEQARGDGACCPARVPPAQLSEPTMGALDLGRPGDQETRAKGEARALVVGSGLGVSRLPGMDQSQGPVCKCHSRPPPGLCTSPGFPSPSSTPALA